MRRYAVVDQKSGLPSCCISRMTSQPPSSSPLTYSWGYVGHCEYSFKPCRTSSSVRMSKVSNETPIAPSAETTFWLKPQRGASGLPCSHDSHSIAFQMHDFGESRTCCKILHACKCLAEGKCIMARLQCVVECSWVTGMHHSGC